MFFLYYAGMARDADGTEQIGLAISDDGRKFRRVRGGGLIVAVDPKLPWKDLRVCNPTVLSIPGSIIMFYQGIAKQPPHHTSIGSARSETELILSARRRLVCPSRP